MLRRAPPPPPALMTSWLITLNISSPQWRKCSSKPTSNFLIPRLMTSTFNFTLSRICYHFTYSEVVYDTTLVYIKPTKDFRIKCILQSGQQDRMLKITHPLGQMLDNLVDIKVTDNFRNKFIFSLSKCQFIISKEKEGISRTVGAGLSK